MTRPRQDESAHSTKQAGAFARIVYNFTFGHNRIRHFLREGGSFPLRQRSPPPPTLRTGHSRALVRR